MEFHLCPWFFLLFIALIKILRAYFPNQALIKSAESTVEEILQTLIKSGVKKEDIIKQLLEPSPPKEPEGKK